MKLEVITEPGRRLFEAEVDLKPGCDNPELRAAYDAGTVCAFDATYDGGAVYIPRCKITERTELPNGGVRYHFCEVP